MRSNHNNYRSDRSLDDELDYYHTNRYNINENIRYRNRSRSFDRYHHTNRSKSPINNSNQYKRPRNVSIKPIVDPLIANIIDDPRIDKSIGLKVIKQKESGRNSESFDPLTTIVRPDMRIRIVNHTITNNSDTISENDNKSNSVSLIKSLNVRLSHDDVIVIPNFFCLENDWSIYYQLINELRDIQAKKSNNNSQWISWHEGTHLITNNPTESKTYNYIINQIADYYNIPLVSVGTRFNWYVDSTDWKPFHHDSAAYNKQRAKNQNITIGVSFGATRELSFLHAGNNTKIDFPQSNGMVFSFGRDVNIRWKHGINALPSNDSNNTGKPSDDRGRISIILWGQCPDIPEEKDSPNMLGDNTGGYGHDVHHAKHNNSNGNSKCHDFSRGHCKYGENCRYLH